MFPGVSKLPIEKPELGLVRLEKPPELGRMIHVFGVAEFMNQHITHKFRGNKKQFRVKRQVAFSRATGPAGALTLYEQPAQFEIVTGGQFLGHGK
jgi:hypothetical protein